MRFKRTKAILLGAIAWIALCQTAHSKVAQAKLADIIKGSDLIALGTVSEVVKIKEYRVAKLKIEGVLKGEAQLQEAYFVASPTWTCDISNAKVGERGLYFFSPANGNLEISPSHNGRPLFLIAHSGHGRLLRQPQGKFHISGAIILPEGFPVERVYRAKGERLDLVSTSDIAGAIRQLPTSKN